MTTMQDYLAIKAVSSSVIHALLMQSPEQEEAI
jgi:hypothetical protein